MSEAQPRSILRSIVALAFAGSAASAAAAGPPPKWQAFADCAAAYSANSRIADPSRPSSMAAQVSEVSSDYAKAAERAYRKETHRRWPLSTGPVTARISNQTAAFSKRPRADIEHFIDACPQPDA